MIKGQIPIDIEIGTASASLSNAAKNNERQYGVIYDLLCAGPINGVVGGLSGIYLNDTPLIDHENYKKIRMKYRVNASITASTGVITATNIFKDVDLANGRRFIQMVTSDGGATPGGISTTLASGIAKDSRSVTAASSVFTFAMALNQNATRSAYLSDHVGFKIRIDGAGPDGSQYNGIITSVPNGAGAGAIVFPPIDTAVNSGANVYIDKFFEVSSITNANSGVLANYTGSNATNVSCIVSQAGQFYNDSSSSLNYENAFAHVTTGTRYQPPVEAAIGYGSAPSASYIISPGTPLTWYAGTGGKTLSPGNATASATFINASDFNLAQNVKNEIDRINITMGFPSGLRYISPKGNDGPAAVEFQIILHYKPNSSDSTFQTTLIHGKNYGGADFINDLHQSSANTTTKTNDYSWITAGQNFDHQDKIDNYFSGHGPLSRHHAGTVVKRAQSASFVQEFSVVLSELQPLHDWKIEIRRLTPDNPVHWNPVEIDDMGAQLFASCNVQTVEAQILDKFTYPTSAYGVVSYSAEDFSTPPKRSYKIQGRKVKVPSNYITREEGQSNEAQYCRNVTTGAKVVDGSGNGVYQSWNGAFRGDQSLSATHANFKKVYTNNPAWIFYDVLTDKEIGLGEYIEESDIDKYALYQIARYCDELVPNGKGRMEPRFSCNVYIKSQAEAYKVLKDLASSFRSMMYWIDGEIVPVQDSPKEPVYNFTTGNVEDGIFEYTYTSQRARPNQINVTWVNPLELYKRTVLTVEDTQNIESVGKVIANDIVAFGCTSEGQARRLADWHLATAKNENELVSFTTGINAAFLRPGDIINVQDKRRHGFEASGRTGSGSGTIGGGSTHYIELDRIVSAPGGGNLNGCNLYLIFTEPGIYLAQDSATINSVAYVRGQLLLENASGGAIATQEQAANLLDDSNNPVITHYSENSRVEVKAITTNASSASTVSVNGLFSSTPVQDTIWAISRKDDINTDDLQEYRILSIAEEEDGKHSIAASLYAKDKFDEIDAEVPITTNDYIPRPRVADPVPAPTGLSFEQLPSSTITKDGTGTTVSVVASWTPPTETYRDSNDTATSIAYRFLSHFEIQHTFPSVNNAAQGSNWSKVRDINGNATTITFSNVDAGTYTMRIRAVNTEGAHSPWNEITREIFSTPPGTSRIARVPRGGFLTFSPEIDASTGLVSIDATAYRYIHPSGEQYIFNPASTAQLQQSFSTLPAGQSAFWVFNASGTSDPWLAMQLHTDTVSTDVTGNPTNFNYLKEIGASNNGLLAASGTVTVASGSTEVTGSSTSFSTEFAVGRFIKISDNSAPGTQVANSEYREIVEIVSNTKLIVRNPFTRAFTAKTSMRQSTAIEFREDAILAEVTRASSGASPYTAEFFVEGKGKRGSDGRTVELEPSSNVINYNTAGAETDTITFTATARQFSGTPYYQFFVGPVGGSLTVKQSFSTSNTFSLADSDEPGIGGAVKVLVETKDGSASGAAVAQDSVTIFGVQDGSDAVTGFLTNESHAVNANFSGGGISSFSSAGGTFKIFVGSTDVTTSCTFSVVSESGVDVSIGSSNGVYTVNSMSLDSGVASLKAVVPAATAGAASNVEITKVYTISKAKNAAPNIVGDLSNPSAAVAANSAGVVTTSSLNTVGGTFEVRKDGVLINSDSAVTFAIQGSVSPSSGFNVAINANTGAYTISGFTVDQGQVTFRATIQTSISGLSSTTTIDKIYTLTRAKEGTEAITIDVSNPVINLPTTTAGVVTYTNSGTDISVKEGSTSLNYGTSGAGTFSIAASGTNITVGSASTVSSTIRRFAAASSISADEAFITFTLTIRRTTGAAAETRTVTQRLVKAKQGATGDQGESVVEVQAFRSGANSGLSGGSYNFNTSTLTPPSGWSVNPISLTSNNQVVYVGKGTSVGASTDTAASITWGSTAIYAQRTDGSTGAAGLRTIQGYLFYEKTSSGAPAAPAGTTYTFSSGVVSGTDINDSGSTNIWRNSPRTQNATSSNIFWTVRYYGTESSAGSSTITVAYSTVVQQTSFTGVVTFSGGTTLTDGSSSTTPLEASDLGSSGSTTIDGGRITTGSIKSANISGTQDGSAFTSAGSLFNLTNGVIASKNFRIDSSGNAAFSGSLTVGGSTVRNDTASNFRSDIGAGTSDFDGDYASLANSPTNLSDFTNDDGFVVPSGVATAINNNTTTINGAKITTGSIDANRIEANTTLSNTVYVGNDLIINSSGAIYTSGKSSWNDSSAGFFLGYENSFGTAAYKLKLGNSQNFISWNGSDLTVSGNITVKNASTVRTALNVEDGSTANPNAVDPADVASHLGGENVTTISGGIINTGTINAGSIKIDNVTLDTDGNNLIIKNSGVNINQLASSSLGTARGVSDGDVSATQQTYSFSLFSINTPSHMIGAWGSSTTLILDEVAAFDFTTAAHSGNLRYEVSFEFAPSGNFSSSSTVGLVYHIQQTINGQSYLYNQDNSHANVVTTYSGYSFGTGSAANRLRRIARFLDLTGNRQTYIRLYGYQQGVTGSQEYDGVHLSVTALTKGTT